MLQDAIWADESRLAEEPEYRDQAVRLVAASMEGWAFCRDNVEACRDIVVASGSTLGASHQLWQMNEINKLIWPAPAGIGIMEPESWEVTKQIALEGKVISKPASDDSYRTDIAEAAVEELKDDDVDVNGEDWQAEEVEVTEGGAR